MARRNVAGNQPRVGRYLRCIVDKETVMKTWIGAAVFAVAVTFGSAAAVTSASADMGGLSTQKNSPALQSQGAQSTEFSSQRRHRGGYRGGHRGYRGYRGGYAPRYYAPRPYYGGGYGRPYGYRPYGYGRPYGGGYGYGPSINFGFGRF